VADARAVLVDGTEQTVAMATAPTGRPREVTEQVDPMLVDEVESASRGLLGLSIRAMTTVEQVSPTQLRALMLLARGGPVNLSVFAGRLGVATSSASRLIDRLIAAGHVERTAPAHSRREVLLQLTAGGRRVVRRHEAARRAIFAELLAVLTPADRDALLRGLRAVSLATREESAADPTG